MLRRSIPSFHPSTSYISRAHPTSPLSITTMWPFSDNYPEVNLDDTRDQYDYVIVGGGTAGCVLANRLSADPSKTVLLVERGPRADTWASRVPLFSENFASDGSAALKRESTVQTELGRSLQLVTGGLLGGTSRINAMVYMRGRPAEYDAWAAEGRKGWSWEDLRPYFLRPEDSKAFGRVKNIHNVGGEWQVRRLPKTYFGSFSAAVEAAKSLGVSKISDLNSPDCSALGYGELTYTIDESGHRHSAYHAFLPAEVAQTRKNLHICTETLAEKLVIERDPSDKFVVRGVRLVSKRGGHPVVKTVSVEKEAILCAGPFGSPQVLMLSGIGPAEHLKGNNIEVIKDLPAVGSNLEDHLLAGFDWKVPMNDSLIVIMRSKLRLIFELLRYLVWGTGLLLAPVVQIQILLHSRALEATGKPSKSHSVSEPIPDIQIMPCAYSSGAPLPQTEGVFSTLCVALHPESRGTVRLSSADPHALLVIDPCYLSSPEDRKVYRAAFRFCLRLAEKMRADGYQIQDYKVPRSESDDDLDAFLRQECNTAYHYCSTCRMAPEHDARGGGVVNDELKVYGVENLRVADSSIFPRLIATNPQAATVAIAGKCAELIFSSGV